MSTPKAELSPQAQEMIANYIRQGARMMAKMIDEDVEALRYALKCKLEDEEELVADWLYAKFKERFQS